MNRNWLGTNAVCKLLTKIVQDFCAEYELAGVELDDSSVSQQLGTLQQCIMAWCAEWDKNSTHT